MMLRYTAQRALQAVLTLWVVLTLTFFLVRLAPGGPFSQEKAVSAEVQAALESRYGMDAPLMTQYIRYLGGVVQGDLGPSISYPGWTVTEILWAKLPVSLELGLWALLIAFGLGVSAGVVSAQWHNRWPDRALMASALTGICLPSFVLGPLLVLVFAIWLPWVNVAGWFGPTDRVLPALTLGLYFAAYIARLTRASHLEVLPLDYLRTARAKGLPEWRVSGVHALRVSLLPVVSYLGPAVAGLVSGSFVVETIFNIPGLGRFFVTSAFSQDYFMIGGCVLLYAGALVSLIFVADLILARLDPRIRLGS